MVHSEALRVLERFKRRLGKLLDLQKTVLFGSRATGVFSEDSDFDILVVSKDFEGVPQHRRASMSYSAWEDERPVELLCYTPAEVNKRLKGPVRGIVAEALETGISF